LVQTTAPPYVLQTAVAECTAFRSLSITIRRIRISIVALGLLAAAVACADDPALTAEPAKLARQWSGTTASPVCGTQGRDGEALPVAGSRYCEWRLVAGSPRDRLTGIVTTETVVVSWVRLMADSVAAGRFADSLRTALADRGLTPRECLASVNLSGETIRQQWDGPGLSVNLSRLATRTGEQRVQVTAATGAGAMPPALCAGAAP
jgi:hypothetical protein